jgi:hypothetical protein
MPEPNMLADAFGAIKLPEEAVAAAASAMLSF